MKLYECTADCLVDWCLLHYYVLARNEVEAWEKGYVHFNYHCNVADGGTVDVKRVTNFNKIRGCKINK